MAVKDAVGRFGEQVAAEHVAGLGYEILSRNWRCREGEIDLVALDGAVLVVVEVKTRSSLAFGTPAEAVSGQKAARLRRLATLWMQDHRSREAAQTWSIVRFDVVGVVRGRSSVEVDHVTGAF